MTANRKHRSENELKIRASIEYFSPSPNWNELKGILNEENLDLDDPKTAGILGKL